MDREKARKERKRSHKYLDMPYGYIIGIPSTYKAATDLSENSDSSEFSEDGDTYETATNRQRTQSPKKLHRDRYVNPKIKVTKGARTAYRRHIISRIHREDTETSESSESPEDSDSSMKQHSPVKTHSPRKLHSKSNVSPGARTDRPAAKRQLSAVRNLFPARSFRRFPYVDPWEVSTGAKTGDRLSVFANPGESLLNVKSGVKHRHSRKENNGDDLNLCQGHEFRAPLVRDVGTKFYTSPPLSGWKQGRLLGAGGFGKVYECIPFSHPLDKLAVKIVKIEPQYTEMSKEHRAIKNEINILMNLRHERIVSFYKSGERDDHLHLFMDFMAGGSLSDYIKNHKVLYESESRRYTKQILEGVNFLHSMSIIHRDIKGSNVLLDGEGNVKLADFGLSKIIQKIGSKTDLLSHCGTPHWMAPEIIRGKGYGRKADIWSVGCTVVEMLTGRPPLDHLEPVAAIFEIGSNPTVPTLPEGVSQDAKEFIQAALTPNPLERPWSEELLEHNFVLVPTDW